MIHLWLSDTSVAHWSLFTSSSKGSFKTRLLGKIVQDVCLGGLVNDFITNIDRYTINILLSLTIAKCIVAPPGPTAAWATRSSSQIRHLSLDITTTNIKHFARCGYHLRWNDLDFVKYYLFFTVILVIASDEKIINGCELKQIMFSLSSTMIAMITLIKIIRQ